MAGKGTFSKFFGFEDPEQPNEDYYDDEEVQAESSYASNASNANNVVSIKSGLSSKQKSEIVIYEPRVYSDAKEIAQNLLHDKAIIINFSRMDDGSARRVVDFITGTVYALEGEIQRVGNKIFLATPKNFQTDGKVTELLDKKDNLI